MHSPTTYNMHRPTLFNRGFQTMKSVVAHVTSAICHTRQFALTLTFALSTSQRALLLARLNNVGGQYCFCSLASVVVVCNTLRRA